MKTHIHILAPLLGMLSAGCSKDTAGIDAMSHKLDVICSNQAIILSEIQAVKTQVTNLPDINRIDDMAFYYHTNELSEFRGRFDTLDEANRVTHDADKWMMNMQIEMATNRLN